jgi:hypothetical protein
MIVDDPKWATNQRTPGALHVTGEWRGEPIDHLGVHETDDPERTELNSRECFTDIRHHEDAGLDANAEIFD